MLTWVTQSMVVIGYADHWFLIQLPLRKWVSGSVSAAWLLVTTESKNASVVYTKHASCILIKYSIKIYKNNINCFGTKLNSKISYVWYVSMAEISLFSSFVFVMRVVVILLDLLAIYRIITRVMWTLTLCARGHLFCDVVDIKLG